MFSSKRKKNHETIPGEDGIAPIKKVNTNAIVFMDDSVNADGSIMLINNEIVNVNTHYDEIYKDMMLEEEKYHSYIENAKKEDADNITVAKEFASTIMIETLFEKEIMEVVYSALNNGIVEFLHHILKHSDFIDATQLIKPEAIKDALAFYVSRPGLGKINIHDDDKLELEFRGYMRNYIMCVISAQVYDAVRDIIYSRDISYYNIQVLEPNKMEITIDNVWFTTHESIGYTLLQIDSGIDIVITKFIYSLKREKGISE